MKIYGILKSLAAAAALCLTAIPAEAQYFVEDGYDYLYEPEHRVVVRKPVECTQDWQDLWNGDYVRVYDNYVYIYRDGYRFTYGDSVRLMHNGQYIVTRSGYEYLLDGRGSKSGVYGDSIYMFWNGVCCALKGGYWQLYTPDGYRLGSIYSDEMITIYWNGTYCYHAGGYYNVADEDGYKISGTYSDLEPRLLDNGGYRVFQGNYSKVVGR